LFYPIETLKHVRWTYKSQENKLTIVQTHLLSFENNQMDIPPIACISADQIQLSVDVTLMYTITRPEIAVYETDDVLNLFYQCAQQTIRSVCNQYKANDLSLSKFGNITESIVSQINDQIEKKGIKCARLVLQNITMDPSILKSYESIFVSQKQSQMAQEQERTEFERKMKSLEYKEKEMKLQNQLLILGAETEAKMNQIKGFSPEHLVKLKEIEALQNVQKVVYLPNSRFNLINES
jgi:regulator of protease activity HflC (stomatin/prohibitin superfamily)